MTNCRKSLLEQFNYDKLRRFNELMVKKPIKSYTDDFVDEFDFKYLDEFDEPSKHNRISRLLTDSAIDKHNLDRYMYIGCYNN